MPVVQHEADVILDDAQALAWGLPVLLVQEIRGLALGHLTAEPGGAREATAQALREARSVARVDPRSKAKVGNDVRMVANLDNVHFFEKDTPENRALR